MSDQAKFATLASSRRTWAVSSIHGEADVLRQLHDALMKRLAPDDNLVYLGNFLGRGTLVRDTVEELLLFRRAFLAHRGKGADGIVFLRGGQEEMWQKLLQIQFAPNPRQVLDWMEENGVDKTLAAYGSTIGQGRQAAQSGPVALSQWTSALRDTLRAMDGHNQLLSHLRRAAFTDDGRLLFVNAGIDVTRPLSQQTDSFWWGGRDFEFIDQPYAGYRKIVRGFDQHHRGVVIHDTTVSIDGGCGFDGPLVAACFDAEGEVVELIEVA